jgi:uncharacterized protein
MATERIAIEVACATPERQTILPLEVDAGSTAEQALEQSGIFVLYPELDRSSCVIGIFGREVPHDRVLEAGDRVEVLRPLTEDPRERRRRLAREGRSMGRGSARRG